MKNLIKTFMLRGFIGMGFGPIVMAIVYLCLQAADVVHVLSVSEAAKGVFSTCVMAFVAAGLPVLYQIERLPLLSAILLHAAGLFLDYLIMYLINDWIPKNFTAISVFAAIFIVGFALIWLLIYLINRKNIEKLNLHLQKQ